jgi:hypothetical protein
MNQTKFLEFRAEYPEFYYKGYDINELVDKYEFIFHFSIPNLSDFNPRILIEKETIINTNKEYIDYLVFHIGLVELISYWKCTCSPTVIIEAGDLDEKQINWFLKLYYNGLGEFFYLNGIDIPIDEFMTIKCNGTNSSLLDINYTGTGNLIAIGGGKDSTVSLELLAGMDNTCFMINPKDPGIECIKAAGYNTYLKIERYLDKSLLDLNSKGFLNGHTPFSALVAFVSYLSAYLTNKKYIVLSNEGSANESTILGTSINHQYSKTYEFENDFNDYSKKYFKLNIHYFSFLRCLSEFQIGMLFSRYKKYHHIFKSCNVGSKSVPWKWCCKCPKCLFVYIILSPFIPKEEIISIFGEDMYENEYLLSTFIELLGYGETKPFECVGTYSEVRYAVSLVINSSEKLPYLLKYFKDNYSLELDVDYRKEFNEQNNIDSEFLDIIKEELSKYAK